MALIPSLLFRAGMWSCERNPNLNLSLKCNLIHLFTSKTASLDEKHGWSSVYLSDTQLYSFLLLAFLHMGY